MKSGPESADARGMPLLADAGLPISPALFAGLFTGMVAAALVLTALRSLAADIEYAGRVRTLGQQAKALREKQAERLRNLIPRRR